MFGKGDGQKRGRLASKYYATEPPPNPAKDTPRWGQKTSGALNIRAVVGIAAGMPPHNDPATSVGLEGVSLFRCISLTSHTQKKNGTIPSRFFHVEIPDFFGTPVHRCEMKPFVLHSRDRVLVKAGGVSGTVFELFVVH